MEKCTYIDGIASSQALDTSGEVVDLKGLDITSLVGAAINYEHEKKLPAQLVGKIVEAKKIFDKTDCENPRHLYYWEKIQLPFLYIKARLLDDRKPSAKEVAALFQDDAAHPDEPDMLGFSVEGAKIEKQGAVITRSIARLVTLANMPANKTCVSEMIPEKDAAIDPSDISELFKGEMQLFAFEPTYVQILEKKEEMKKDVGSGGGAFIGSQLAMKEKQPKLKKALTAGSGMAAPSQLVGGAALAVEDLDGDDRKELKRERKNLYKKESKWYGRADDAYKTWDKREQFRKYMKERMPHLAGGEVDAIGRVLALKKNLQAEDKLSKMYASHYVKKEKVAKGSDVMMASEKKKD